MVDTIENEEKVIFSSNVETYFLGGWLRGAKGKLYLYKDKIVFKRFSLIGQSDNKVINLNDIESFKFTKVTGFFNAGIYIKSKSGDILRIYTLKRNEWESYLVKYLK